MNRNWLRNKNVGVFSQMVTGFLVEKQIRKSLMMAAILLLSMVKVFKNMNHMIKYRMQETNESRELASSVSKSPHRSLQRKQKISSVQMSRMIVN